MCPTIILLLYIVSFMNKLNTYLLFTLFLYSAVFWFPISNDFIVNLVTSEVTSLVATNYYLVFCFQNILFVICKSIKYIINNFSIKIIVIDSTSIYCLLRLYIMISDSVQGAVKWITYTNPVVTNSVQGFNSMASNHWWIYSIGDLFSLVYSSDFKKCLLRIFYIGFTYI